MTYTISGEATIKATKSKVWEILANLEKVQDYDSLIVNHSTCRNKGRALALSGSVISQTVPTFEKELSTGEMEKDILLLYMKMVQNTQCRIRRLTSAWKGLAMILEWS